jgi:hypothetical protein
VETGGQPASGQSSGQSAGQPPSGQSGSILPQGVSWQ